MSEQSRIFSSMLEAGKKASLRIKQIYESSYEVMTKDDNSPVTTADLASDAIIQQELSAFPDIYYLSEERADDSRRLSMRELFIVDPLDGTKDFVNRDGSFSVNIAYVKDRRPVIAFIFLPMLDSYCYAVKGEGAYYVENGKTERMHVSDRTDSLIYLASKTNENEKEKEVYTKHSSLIKEVLRLGASVKGVHLSRGLGDASVRYTDMTKEWDVCAMDLIVNESGGIFLDTNLNRFLYNREDVYNRRGYCMFNRKENEILLS